MTEKPNWGWTNIMNNTYIWTTYKRVYSVEKGKIIYHKASRESIAKKADVFVLPTELML